MNNKTLIWILFIVVIVAGILMYFNFASKETATKEDSLPDDEIVTEETPLVLAIELFSQNNSGQAGLVTLTETGSQTTVRLDVLGAPEGVAQPAHIHIGSCAETGAIKYPLESFLNIPSETIIDVSLNDLLTELPLAINVHKSAQEIETSVACGDITGQ